MERKEWTEGNEGNEWKERRGMKGRDRREGREGRGGRDGREGRGELDACPGAQGHHGAWDRPGASHGRPVLLFIDSLGPSIWCHRKGRK